MILSTNDIEDLEASSQIDFVRFFQSREVQSKSVLRLVEQVYCFATERSYNVEQKTLIFNALLTLVRSIPHVNHQKHHFVQELDQQMQKIASRQPDHCKYFQEEQIVQVRKCLADLILPCYEIYEIVLDPSPFFAQEAQVFIAANHLPDRELSNATLVDVETVTFFKQFIGIRQPKEDKKDLKKK